jgi:uncharacterized protein
MRKLREHHRKPAFLYIESYLIFICLPMVAHYASMRLPMFVSLWCLSVFCMVYLSKVEGIRFRKEWNWPAVNRLNLKSMLIRFALLAPLLTGLTWILMPERFFAFPTQRPSMWALVMLLYPLLSVFPQEILYRSYFFTRYKSLFGKNIWHTLLVNGMLFGYVHIVLKNEVAIILSAIGGVLFAHTYYKTRSKTRSLALVTIEHALYGNWIFTVGMGWYFYGIAWAAK